MHLKERASPLQKREKQKIKSKKVKKERAPEGALGGSRFFNAS
jgi:hypothetical protein